MQLFNVSLADLNFNKTFSQMCNYIFSYAYIYICDWICKKGLPYTSDLMHLKDCNFLLIGGINLKFLHNVLLCLAYFKHNKKEYVKFCAKHTLCTGIETSNVLVRILVESKVIIFSWIQWLEWHIWWNRGLNVDKFNREWQT